jgi:hypothetical protein
MGTVNHRFGLRRPELLSAPGEPELKTSAALSNNWAFQAVIWFGWTSNIWASSASVFSPFSAAKATFALKAAVWLRRGRLVMVFS